MLAGTPPNIDAHDHLASIARRGRTRARLAHRRDTPEPARDRLAAAAERELVLAA
jgi:hypothetical protein